MKYLKPFAASAAAFTIAAQPISAGNMAAPIMEEDPIVEEAATSSGGILVPILFLLLLAATFDNGGSAPVIEAE